MNPMNDTMERSYEQEEDYAVVPAPGTQETAQDMEESLTLRAQEEDALEREDEAGALKARVREGVGELFEDGWTAQELTAFSRDPLAQEAIAAGKSVARAACDYLRRGMAKARKGGVPTARTIATRGFAQESPIQSMTDEQFDAFSRRAQQAAMEGRKVRI